METNKKKLITHNGSFHSDDIFACATLSIFLENKGEKFEVFRTRDPEIIRTGDFVFDIGGVHDPDKNLFDHHQVGGAGKHKNGIEYASFGLVWNKFGGEICGSPEAAEIIEKKLVSPVDAHDNGFDLVLNKHEISPYKIQDLFGAMRPTWREEDLEMDQMFMKCVAIAKEILSREIIQAKDSILAERSVILIYQDTEDKRIIVLDKNYPCEYTLNNLPEPIFVIYPRESDNLWGVKAVREDPKTFKNRKNFPSSWGGLRDEELQKATGVPEAVFCHRGLFMCVAKSKEGAIKLAQIALKN